MLVALRDADDRVIADRALERAIDYRCPVCGSGVVLKAGSRVVAHFAHRARGDCIAEGESRRHLAAKKLLHDRLAARGFRVTLEVMLSPSRRADLVVHDGGGFTIEIQASRIAVEDMKRREAADRNAGYLATCWIFTENRIGPAVFDHVDELGTREHWERWAAGHAGDGRDAEARLADDVRYRWNATHEPVVVLHHDHLYGLYGLWLRPVYRLGEEYYDEYGDAQSPDGRWLRRTRAVGLEPLVFVPMLRRDRYNRTHAGFAGWGQVADSPILGRSQGATGDRRAGSALSTGRAS